MANYIDVEMEKSKDHNTTPFKVDEDILTQAYLYLKNYAYYENMNFFLKQRIAEFEGDVFEKKIEKLSTEFNKRGFTSNSFFKECLKSIDFHVLPKSILTLEEKDVDQDDQNKGLYISNISRSSEYRVCKVNYFVNACIELHIIEFLWCLIVGPILEEDLSEHCYGNRMDEATKNFRFRRNAGQYRRLFKYFYKQYSSWRDRGISIACKIHENNQDVALLSLDLKSYFYSVNLDFGKIDDKIKEAFGEEGDLSEIASKLNNALKEIFSRYRDQLSPDLKLTHSECNKNLGLPIGFASSAILSNWYLRNFDKDVVAKARPDYYGRYVDDIIMVFRNPETFIMDKSPIIAFVDRFLGEIFKRCDDHSTKKDFYIKVDDNEISIQQEKLIFYLLDKEHPRALLEVFRKELQERSSAFRFLPSDDIDGELDRFAYEILYNGSHNKLRSITDILENETELVSYLTKQIILHRLCKIDKKNYVVPQLKRFFKGKNALRFNRLWEKVYQYAVVIKDYNFIQDFYDSLNQEIDKAGVYVDAEGDSQETSKNPNLSTNMKDSLTRYNLISLGLSIALVNKDFLTHWPRSKYNSPRNRSSFSKLIKDDDFLNMVKTFRESNLIRHHLVAWPMANYTSFTGDLTDEPKFDIPQLDEQEQKRICEKIKRSPRFIHFDEMQVFCLRVSLSSHRENSVYRWQTIFQRVYKEKFDDTSTEISEDDSSRRPIKDYSELLKEFLNEEFSQATDSNLCQERLINDIEIENKSKIPEKKVRIALANIKVKMSSIENAIRKDREPNVNFERQKDLYEILNSAVRDNAGILVMPELSIPVSWLPFMVAHSRKHQQVMIFGLEHWEMCGTVYNLLVELLPFKVSEKYRSCFITARIKNHYAPKEVTLIQSIRLTHPNVDHYSYYNKIKWRGITFASYNCFELSDIEHRALLRSQIDILFSCSYNKDVNYYQSIIESTIRDLHCYVIYSNSSDFGGSCVLQPAKTEEKTMLYMKGGENPSIMVAEVNVAALRDFHYKPTHNINHTFKPLPPGFDSENE